MPFNLYVKKIRSASPCCERGKRPSSSNRTVGEEKREQARRIVENGGECGRRADHHTQISGRPLNMNRQNRVLLVRDGSREVPRPNWRPSITSCRPLPPPLHAAAAAVGVKAVKKTPSTAAEADRAGRKTVHHPEILVQTWNNPTPYKIWFSRLRKGYAQLRHGTRGRHDEQFDATSKKRDDHGGGVVQ